MRIFVYGTLKRGFGNHRLLATATFVGEATTLPHYTMEAYRCPRVSKGGTTSIHGEVYEVDQRTLQNLDRLEGHPTLYCRTTITLADGTKADIYLTHRGDPNANIIHDGRWTHAHR